MPTIRFFDHPFDASEPEIIDHWSFAEWLIDRFGVTPSVQIQIFRGEPSAATEITHDLDAIVYGRDPVYTVLQSPGGFVAALPMWALIAGGVALSAAVVYLMAPKAPSYSGLANNNIGSPNNDLAERTNKVRVLKRIEDIYGTVRSLPSLIMPTYTKYIDHVQYEYGYYCVGRGYYSIADLRDGETLLADIDGARAAIYDPFTSPNSGDAAVATIGDTIEDDILTVSRSNEIDGVTLKALNQVQLKTTDAYDFIPAALFPASGDVIRQTTAQPSIASVVSSGDTLTVSMSTASSVLTSSAISASTTDDSFNGTGFNSLGLVADDTITVSGFVNAGNNGTFTVVSATNTKIVVSANLLTESYGSYVTISRTVNYSGTYTVDTVGDGYVVLTTSTFAARVDDKSCSIQIDGIDEWTGWITLPQVSRAQVWCNFIAINGIYKDAGGGKQPNSVDVEIQIESLTSALAPTGTVETVTETLSGATSDTRAATVETVTGFTGPCRVRARRSSLYDYTYGGAVVDEIKWQDLYAVTPVTSTDFGNVTTIQTVTKATLLALAAKQRQLNCLASRLLPRYDGEAWSGAFDSVGRHTSGTIAATSRFVDIVAAVSIDPWIGARDITDLDMRQLWATYQSVSGWYADFASFDYTFDSDNTSYEDAVRMIADACFCTAYRQNGKVRFAFNREQTSPNLPTFTHRNKRPDSETITRSFANDGEYDGVELVYTDPDTERQETIRLPLNGNYSKLKKVEIPGIRSFVTAWVRANRELQRLRNQRLVLEFEATTDARLLLPGTRIDVVDDTRFTRYGGEVVAQSGLELTLSQPVSFTAGESHSIILMRRDGTTQSIVCTAGSSANKVILQGLPDEAVVTAYSQDGIRTIYSFASDSTRASQSWLVQEIEPRDQDYVRIRAINYTADYYAYDSGEIPDRNEIIYT